MNDTSILEGAISVKAAVEAGVRKILSVSADKNRDDRNISYIIRKAREKNIKVNMVTRDELSKICGDNECGGICAEVLQRTYADPLSLLTVNNPFIVFLEGIEDPYNFGYAVRDAYAAGATGLLVPSRSWQNAESTVLRSSAGASEYIPTASVQDPVSVLNEAHRLGISVVAADRKDATALYDTDMTGPIILAIGGRLRGLSKPVYDSADRRVYIPYGSDFRNSLSASSACAVMAFEIMRQRRASK